MPAWSRPSGMLSTQEIKAKTPNPANPLPKENAYNASSSSMPQQPMMSAPSRPPMQGSIGMGPGINSGNFGFPRGFPGTPNMRNDIFGNGTFPGIGMGGIPGMNRNIGGTGYMPPMMGNPFSGNQWDQIGSSGGLQSDIPLLANNPMLAGMASAMSGPNASFLRRFGIG